MTAPGFRGTFLTARPVPSRGVVSFIFDVPTEEASAALALLGGFPTGGTSVWVGIAPLKPEAVAKPDARERYAQMTQGEQAVARAGVLAADKAFQDWCGVVCEEDAADYIRNQCGVTTRRSFTVDGGALRKFIALEARFKSERRFGPHAAR